MIYLRRYAACDAWFNRLMRRAVNDNRSIWDRLSDRGKA